MAKTTKTTDENDEEGPRGFALILGQIGDGDLHSELGLELQKLVGQCTHFASRYEREGKGVLTLKLTIKAMANGAVAVAGDFASKGPTAPRAGSVFYATKGNNLTLENPRQQKLPLREVVFDKPLAKELNDERPVRGV